MADAQPSKELTAVVDSIHAVVIHAVAQADADGLANHRAKHSLKELSGRAYRVIAAMQEELGILNLLHADRLKENQ